MLIRLDIELLDEDQDYEEMLIGLDVEILTNYRIISPIHLTCCNSLR